MKRKFSLAGPVGGLQGVIHECESENGRRTVLVMAHGFRGSMDGGGRASLLAEEISETVCTVVRFNFTRCTMLRNQVAELKAVLDFVRETMRPEKLFLLGRSFGGATCIITACGKEAPKGGPVSGQHSADVAEAASPATGDSAAGYAAAEQARPESWHARNTYRPDGLVLWSAPNSLKKTFVQVLGEESFQRALQGEAIVLSDERGHDEIPASFVTDLLQYDLAALLQGWQDGPLLILHGEKDCIVTPEQAQANYDLAGGDKELHYMKDDDHHLALRCREAGAIVKRWLAEHS